MQPPTNQGEDNVVLSTETSRILANESACRTESEHDLLIWVDAVTINQRDNIEKGWQVAQTADIYTDAAQTYIFLGPKTEHSDTAVNFLGHVSTLASSADISPLDAFTERLRDVVDDLQRQSQEQTLSTADSPEARIVNAIIRRVGSESIQATLCDLLSSIMGCAWWARICKRNVTLRNVSETYTDYVHRISGTLQECVLSSSPTFVRGYKSFKRPDLFPALNSIAAFGAATIRIDPDDSRSFARSQFVDCIKAGYFSRPAMYLNSEGVQHLQTLEKFINVIHIARREGSSLEATDPRDCIYGLLSFVRTWKHGQRRVKPDYTLDTAEVYTNTALSLLESGYNQSLRLAVQLKGKRHWNLPSWVPDWSRQRNTGLLHVQDAMETVGTTALSETHADGKHTITIPGQNYGILKQLGPWHLIQKTFTGILEDISIESVDQIKTYLENLVATISQRLVHESDLGLQLDMLNIAMAIQLMTGKETDKRISAIWLERSGKLAYDRNVDDRIGWTGDWNRAAIMRDIMCDPTILDTSPILTMSDDAKDEMLFSESLKTEDEKRVQALFHAWHGLVIVLKKCVPFVAGGICTGVASKEIRDGETLVKFDMDPTTMYVVRPAGDGMWQLVSLACVPQMWLQDDFAEGERAEFQLC
jgi:hypothetical protein